MLPPPPLLRKQPLRLDDELCEELTDDDLVSDEPTLVYIPKLRELSTEDIEITYPVSAPTAAAHQATRVHQPTNHSSWPPAVLDTKERTSHPRERLGSRRAGRIAIYALGGAVVLTTSLVTTYALLSPSRPPSAVVLAASSSSPQVAHQQVPRQQAEGSSDSGAGDSDGAHEAGPQAPQHATKPDPSRPAALEGNAGELSILLDLADSLIARGRDAEAVTVLERALARDDTMRHDPALGRLVRRTALSTDRAAAAASHALLTGPMGDRGAEILYEISISPDANASARRRANAYLRSKDFERQAPLPIYAAYKILTASTCEEKKSLLPFAEKAGGRHVVELLREIDKRKICSLDDLDNCYSCMNIDKKLPHTIARLEKRLQMARLR